MSHWFTCRECGAHDLYVRRDEDVATRVTRIADCGCGDYDTAGVVEEDWLESWSETGELDKSHDFRLDDQEKLGEDGRKVFEGMKAVNATIRVDILDAGESYFLNITEGRMAAGEQATHPPFLTLRQNRAAYERLAAETVAERAEVSPRSLVGSIWL